MVRTSSRNANRSGLVGVGTMLGANDKIGITSASLASLVQ